MKKNLSNKANDLFILMQLIFILDDVVLEVELVLELVDDVEPDRIS